MNVVPSTIQSKVAPNSCFRVDVYDSPVGRCFGHLTLVGISNNIANVIHEPDSVSFKTISKNQQSSKAICSQKVGASFDLRNILFLRKI